jgi:signal transduction histidine kinase
MARWRSRAIDSIIAGGIAVSLGFAMRPRAHSLTRFLAAIFALTASTRMLARGSRPGAGNPAAPAHDAITNGTLVAIVAHEIRAPLSAIRGAASLLDEYDGQLDGKRRSELLAVTLDASQQLARLVDDLLLVSRITAGRLAVERTEVDLVSLVRAAARTELSPSVTIVTQESLPGVHADAVRTRQVVTNLLANAINHASEKSIVIVSIVADGAFVRTTIFNEGRGIPPDEQSKLFLPFANLSESRIDSTGLGLYIAKQLVNAMGGSIGFDTQPGHNAVFWFTLPAAPAHSHSALSV